MCGEMKLRAWDGFHEKMSYGETEQFDDMLGFRFDHFDTEKPVYMKSTGMFDQNEKEIWGSDIVRIPVEINQELHGKWADYEVVYRNGQWIASYLSSEKGAVLPRNYLASPLILYREHDKDAYFADNRLFQKIDVTVVGNIYENPELLGVKP
ncbi:hypothetical protein ADMFC3_28010 [Geovibrio sp. ADMFC3]|nr:hypothetical protein [Deferribacteraceae bacterium]